MVRGGKLRRRYWDEHLFVSVISNLSSQHEQKAAVRQKVKRGPTNVPSTLHIMYECQCLNTRFTCDHTQMLDILLQIIVRGENLEAEKRERADKQAGNVINETEDSQNSASGRTESAATATT